MQELQNYLIQGATNYLEFLEQNNLGIEEIGILDVRVSKYNTLLLNLDRPLVSTDFLQLYIFDLMIDIESMEEKSFNESTRVLSLRFSDTLLFQLLKALQKKNEEEAEEENDRDSEKKRYIMGIPSDIKSLLPYLIGTHKGRGVPPFIGLFSDLKFLVKNIKDFCKQDDLRVQLPKKKPSKLTITLDSHINAEQRAAIEGIFSNPVSYIWGISGSGKTQVVLFYCLMNLIAQQKKTLILAPTNTALEQIFIALITQGDKKGLPRAKFLRLGMPSSEFLQNYPDVCVQNDEKDEVIQTELFKPQSLKERLQDSLVVGVTLDSFVKRYTQLCELQFAHIFLDECAFSPLIKLIAPLTLGVPLTLLGDHKQLMPICLMDENMITQNYPAACVWNLNTLFLETLLNSHQTLHTHNNHDDIAFNAIAHYRLTTTHRYGNNLAQVLDFYVYRNGLRGVGVPTEIYYIDSMAFGENYSYNPTKPRNENMGEANAISMLVRKIPDDYAVLTPFRDQQKLLVSKGINRHQVFTIHKSQGKEFDTIIFSPVKYSKHMTDSYNKAALFALNVAISRLRKRLIIVCDYNFWIRKNTQFIGALLRNAKPYPIM